MKSILLLAAAAPLALAWLPDGKVRGVNLGSHFIFEPWISNSAWSNLGCSGQNSEFDCVLKLGQDAADKAFASHWGSWTTQDDISQMREYGLNTVRIPVGYWIKEDLVDKDSEHFPRGGLKYLEDVCGWASDAGMYIIMDFHGLPGAQEAEQPFTGQVINSISIGIFRVICDVDLLVRRHPRVL
jgi:aryl-phospho-beta-D-glucosidase BglC (GH1 family)